MLSAPCSIATRDEGYRGEHQECAKLGAIVHANTGYTADAATRYVVSCDCACHEGEK